jgi:hypothetical protein
MGTGRYISHKLQKHFDLTEAEADQKVQWIEAITSMQDELATTMFMLVEEGNLQESLSDLNKFRGRLNNAAMNLQASFAGVKKRPEPLGDDYDYADSH